MNNYHATLSVNGSSINDNHSNVDGGGIYSIGTLSVANSTISGNSAYVRGGGIFNYGHGTLSVTDSSVNGNEALFGAGISNDSTLSAANSTISGNHALADGGGVYNDFYGALSVTDSTISGNSAVDDGGGIYNRSDHGMLGIANSTIGGNGASWSGGGIYNNGTLTVTDCTLAANRADMFDYTSPYIPFVGGGLAGSGTNVTLNNTIVAGNLRGTGLTGDDISWNLGGIPEASHNLIGNGSTSGGIVNGVNGNIVGVSDLTTIFVDVNHDGRIDASDLADNGGPTETYALAPLSPAINAGDDALVPAGITTDQRGVGYARFVGTVDIGAVEEQNHSPVVSDFVVKADENVAVMLSSNVFDAAYTDAEGDALSAVRIDSLPADGELLLDGQAVVAGEVVSRADLSSFVYQPDQNYSGNDAFAFSASDGISFSETDATLTVDVLTRRQAVEDLLAKLHDLNLARNVEKSLGAKLDSANQLLGQNGNDSAVLAHLNAFMKDVSHWTEKGLIGANDQANLLIAANLIEQSILSGAV